MEGTAIGKFGRLRVAFNNASTSRPGTCNFADIGEGDIGDSLNANDKSHAFCGKFQVQRSRGEWSGACSCIRSRLKDVFHAKA